MDRFHLAVRQSWYASYGPTQFRYMLTQNILGERGVFSFIYMYTAPPSSGTCTTQNIIFGELVIFAHLDFKHGIGRIFT